MWGKMLFEVEYQLRMLKLLPKKKNSFIYLYTYNFGNPRDSKKKKKITGFNTITEQRRDKRISFSGLLKVFIIIIITIIKKGKIFIIFQR